MPMLADLKKRFAKHFDEPATVPSREPIFEREAGEEILVADNRAYLSPTQCVDQKLQEALNCGQFIAISLSAPQRRKPR